MLAHPSEKLRMAASRYIVEAIAVKRQQATISRVAERQGLTEHRVEHRREVAARGIDYLEYLGGCGLLRTGLCELRFKRGYARPQISGGKYPSRPPSAPCHLVVTSAYDVMIVVFLRLDRQGV